MKTILLKRVMVTSALVMGFLSILITGCQTSNQNQSKANPDAKKVSKSTGKGGAQLWSENCARCHNYRSPSSYSDAQWEVAMFHMRVRANLTAEEHKKILAFLKSGN